jgi:hypothetical protein
MAAVFATLAAKRRGLLARWPAERCGGLQAGRLWMRVHLPPTLTGRLEVRVKLHPALVNGWWSRRRRARTSNHCLHM